MVEGPGATRNARKVQRVIGWKLDKAVKNGIEFQRLPGSILKEAFCVGKEVFLCFEDTAIRVHFGMNGSLWVRSETSKNGSWNDIALALYLRNNQDDNQVLILETAGTTISDTTVRVAQCKRERLSHLDICAETFQLEQVVLAVKSRPESMISDVLLDQSKVPGVGNIIKIEGLHQAGIHPRRTVQSLNDAELTSVIQRCRAYAMSWFERGRAPTKHVYNATICGSCKKTSVRIVKLGDDLRRVTFWCEMCQPLAKKGSSRLEEPCSANVQCSDKRPNRACPQHGQASLLLRRVRKADSSNRLRLFYACRHRNGCQFFQWADSHLPSCRCGKKCCMLISKTARTGGRWFLACPQKKCGHFAWASTAQIIAFGPQLTPLR